MFRIEWDNYHVSCVSILLGLMHNILHSFPCHILMPSPSFRLQVEAILDKDNFTLEELLDEDEIIQECKALNGRLLNLYVPSFFFLLFMLHYLPWRG